jgi:hypothetical protein
VLKSRLAGWTLEAIEGPRDEIPSFSNQPHNNPIARPIRPAIQIILQQKRSPGWHVHSIV